MAECFMTTQVKVWYTPKIIIIPESWNEKINLSIDHRPEYQNQLDRTIENHHRHHTTPAHAIRKMKNRGDNYGWG